MSNLYGILPASIRHDQNLQPAAKVLYAEITSITSLEGICVASNETLGDLYGVTPVTISLWLKSLKKAGYINISYRNGSNDREIKLEPLKENYKRPYKKFKGDPKQVYNDNIDIYNNNNNNNIYINKYSQVEKSKGLGDYSDLILKAYDHIVLLFPERFRPRSESKKLTWLDTLDKLERLDGYSLQVVYYVAKKTREDEFWQTNFMSITKLRMSNKQGIKYIDYFKERFAKEIPFKIKNK